MMMQEKPKEKTFFDHIKKMLMPFLAGAISYFVCRKFGNAVAAIIPFSLSSFLIGAIVGEERAYRNLRQKIEKANNLVSEIRAYIKKCNEK